MAKTPAVDWDICSNAAIANPYPLYHTIRDLGPAVWLSAHEAWAIGRFEDVRAALRADRQLVSGHGVMMNSRMNDRVSRNALVSDGDIHRQLREVVMRPLQPTALREVQTQIHTAADDLVAELLSRDGFDGMNDFAQHLPVEIVSRLVGLPEDGRQRMRAWAAAMFNATGTMNERGEAALPAIVDMVRYAKGLERHDVRAGSWAAGLFAAVDAGQLEARDRVGLLLDYIAPSLDTTVLALGHLLFQLGRHPGQWRLVRDHPELIPRAVDETLRFEAPARLFTRLALEDYRVGPTTIPAGDRVVILYGSANRDERRYAEPDRFDVTRDAGDHLALGHGVHRCAGANVADLEMQALLRAMAARVRRIEVGEPVVLLNNTWRGYASFPAAFH